MLYVYRYRARFITHAAWLLLYECCPKCFDAWPVVIGTAISKSRDFPDIYVVILLLLLLSFLTFWNVSPLWRVQNFRFYSSDRVIIHWSLFVEYAGTKGCLPFWRQFLHLKISSVRQKRDAGNYFNLLIADKWALLASLSAILGSSDVLFCHGLTVMEIICVDW
jgi:hypothetical protein